MKGPVHQTRHATQTSHILPLHMRQVHELGAAHGHANLAEQEHGDQARDLRRTIVGQVSEVPIRLRCSENPAQVTLELVNRSSRHASQNGGRPQRHHRRASRRRRRGNGRNVGLHDT